MANSALVFLISCFVTIFHQCITDTCSGQLTCDSCTRTSDWTGDCRWCPATGQCYLAGILTFNPCKPAENIIDPHICPNQFPNVSSPAYQYNESLARDMWELAAAAYTSDQATCVGAGNVSDFKVVSVYSASCDMFGSSCSAFTAYSTSRNTAALVFRGTNSPIQLLLEGLGVVSSMQEFEGGQVEGYYANGFQSLWPCAKEDLKRLKSSFPTATLWITGHSLGGSMASLASTTIAKNQIWESEKIFMITFGMPRVGDSIYAQIHDKYIPNSWRVVHNNDAVPHLPPCKGSVFSLVGYCVEGSGNPYHHGYEIWYPNSMNRGDEYKVCSGNPVNEDKLCSNSLAPEWVADIHFLYFRDLRDIVTRCEALSPTTTTTTETPSNNFFNIFKFKMPVFGKQNSDTDKGCQSYSSKVRI